MPKRIASLFSGCGGLDLGFTGGFTFRGHEYNRLNTTILFANDFDQDAQTCYNANPLLAEDGAECLLADIRDESTLKSKACLKCLYFTIIIFDLCRYQEYFSYLCTIHQTE